MKEFAEKCREMFLMLCIKFYMAMKNLKGKAKSEFTALAMGEAGVSGIVVSLILIAIAIVLAVIFRDKISELIDKIFNKAEDELDL